LGNWITGGLRRVAGIDIGKDTVSVCLLPDGEYLDVTNDAKGITALVKRCKAALIERVAMESTSIYHKACARALSDAGIEVAVLQPVQVKAFARFKLQRAKTDEIDAVILASVALALDEVVPLHSAQIDALAEHMTFLEQLDESIAWNKTRRERFTNAALLKSLRAILIFP
jgi:transposase